MLAKVTRRSPLAVGLVPALALAFVPGFAGPSVPVGRWVHEGSASRGRLLAAVAQRVPLPASVVAPPGRTRTPWPTDVALGPGLAMLADPETGAPDARGRALRLDGRSNGAEDPDGDRLSNAVERRLGLDPLSGDTDGDGIRDGAEDLDGDGLSNAGEARYQLNGNRRDTDGDGTDDWQEDSDGDGLANGLEQDAVPVPDGVAPPLRLASGDRPPSYMDGCHLKNGQTIPGTCFYGVPGSNTTVVVFGDSHAAQWLPAVIEIAERRQWRVASVTKSGCPSASVTTWSAGPRTECNVWRNNAFEYIASLKPDLVVTSNYGYYSLYEDGYRLPRSQFEKAWRDGLVRSLRRLGRDARHVALLTDSPHFDVDVAPCLIRNARDMSRCATRRSDAISGTVIAAERGAAMRTGVTITETAGLICPYDPCPVVVDRWLIIFDRGHLTATYSRKLSRGLERRLPRIDV